MKIRTFFKTIFAQDWLYLLLYICYIYMAPISKRLRNQLLIICIMDMKKNLIISVQTQF